jgi:hypothetical protein
MTAARFAEFSDNAHVSCGLRSVRVLRRHASTTSRRSGEKPRPTCLRLTQFASNCVQNRAFYGSISGRKASKANYVNRTYGAGDGNRTHVRSLGSFYTAIVRRPLNLPTRSIIHNLANASFCNFTACLTDYMPRASQIFTDKIVDFIKSAG